MISLTQAVLNNHVGKGGFDRTAFTSLQDDVLNAAKYHTSTSHITTSYSDGSSSRVEVTWFAKDQLFADEMGDYRLHGPDSMLGNGRWVLKARHDVDPVVKAILARGEVASKYNRVGELWNLYWQLLLLDRLNYNTGFTIDLHINPLDVESLEKRPGRKEKPDYSHMYLDPNWDDMRMSHNVWKNHIDPAVRDVWSLLSPQGKEELFEQACEKAGLR